MRYLKKRRFSTRTAGDDDPLSGVANLFDVGLVFIVGLFLALMTVYHIMDFFSETSEITIMKKNEQGELEIITKKGKEIKIEKVTDKKIGGEEGMRLGTAYQLKDGRMIYVPDENSK
ncbi:TPA: DUF2149 domain-containing protein [Candidatus Poribacteria bacterium]|nr:DUF2149 domain-containing protein [Candidatus Poribacteria bacterium]